MKYQSAVVAALLGMTSANPAARHGHTHSSRHIAKRQVPQELSHDLFLRIVQEFSVLDNKKQIVDSVFGLLGNAAASQGAGLVTNFDCLKQETADQAFTNAKAILDLRGMSAALVYQALERNTGKVGQASVLCTETPVNPEIGAFSQHQDAASPNATEINRAITLELAKQLALIGGDPLLALESGTFAPGDVNDPTGAGKTCDVADCIFKDRLLVLDATPDEITAAVQGITPTITATGELKATHIDFNGLPLATGGTAVVNGGGAQANNGTQQDDKKNNGKENKGKGNMGKGNKGKGNMNKNKNKGKMGKANNAKGNNGKGKKNNGKAAGANNNAACTPTQAAAAAATPSCTVITTTVAATAAAALASNAPAGAVQTATAAGTNIQAFSGTLGGPAPAVVSSTGARPFSVNGNTFVGSGAALGRSCDIQHNACANAANSGQLAGGVAQCDQQNAACRSSNNLRKRYWKRQAANFGSCTDPSIVFSNNLPDRQEAGFIPNNLKDFGHGSAQKIGIIASFICQRLQDSCKAGADTVALCGQAQTAAAAATQDKAAADAFNSVLLGSGAGNAKGNGNGNGNGKANGAGNGGAAAAPAAPQVTQAPAATACAAAVVMTITSCA